MKHIAIRLLVVLSLVACGRSAQLPDTANVPEARRYQEVNGATPIPGRKVVRVVLEFSQFLPNRSLLDCYIELHDKRGGVQTLSYPGRLKVLPVTKDGRLSAVKHFARLNEEEAVKLSRLVMKVRLDALGDGKYVLPDSRKQQFQESEFVCMYWIED